MISCCSVPRSDMQREAYYAAIRRAGFEAVDLNETADGSLYELPDGGRDALARVLAEVKAAGLAVGQCHAPFLTTVGDLPSLELARRQRQVVTCAATAAALHIPFTVVHPLVWSWEEDPPSRADLIEQNAAYLRQVLAAADGTVICLENMPGEHGCFTDPAALKEVLDAVGDPRLAVCLDTGHAIAAGASFDGFFDTFGDRIRVTHIHDAFPGKDKHLPVYAGSGDWDTFRRVTAGYKGNFNSESKAPRTVPLTELDEALRNEAMLMRSLCE